MIGWMIGFVLFDFRPCFLYTQISTQMEGGKK